MNYRYLYHLNTSQKLMLSERSKLENVKYITILSRYKVKTLNNKWLNLYANL